MNGCEDESDRRKTAVSPLHAPVDALFIRHRLIHEREELRVVGFERFARRDRPRGSVWRRSAAGGVEVRFHARCPILEPVTRRRRAAPQLLDGGLVEEEYDLLVELQVEPLDAKLVLLLLPLLVELGIDLPQPATR